MNKPIFSVEGTSLSPSVFLDAKNGIIIISGIVSLENTDEFFDPILRFIDNHFDESDSILCEVKLTYFNSSGSKKILEIFRKLDEYFKKGKEVLSKWYYQEDDEEVMNEGEYLQELVRFPVELFEINEN